MSLTKITRTVVDSISSFFNINNTTGAVTSIVPDLIGSNTTLYPSFACRAWVNFDGTRDSTGASNTNNTNRFIRGSGNVASVLRNGTGDYTITFTIAMPDTNYAESIGIGSPSPNITAGTVIAEMRSDGSKTASSIRFTVIVIGSNTKVDEAISLMVFR